MPDRPNFSIPENLTPETFCLCLQIPNDPTWVQTFVGLLAQPTYWFNWDRDAARSGKILSEYWTKLFDEIDWSTMSCCCDNPPAIFRYTDAGVYQRSTDGGATWTDAPDFDYRNISTLFPPPSAIGITNTKCQAADGVVQTIKVEIVEALDATFAVAQILSLIAAVLLAILSAGSLAAFTPLITAIGAAILDVGVSATQAAFTTAVWDRLRCNIYCHMNSDNSIDATGLAAILSQLTIDESGIVETVLYGIINAAGIIGITNMIRSNKGDPDADCSACCPVCGSDWVAYPTYGDPLTFGTDAFGAYIQGTPVLHAGVYYFIIHSPGDDNDCCTLDNVRNTDGTTPTDGGTLYIICGQPKAGTYHNFSGTPVATNEVQVQRTAATPTRIYLT